MKCQKNCTGQKRHEKGRPSNGKMWRTIVKKKHQRLEWWHLLGCKCTGDVKCSTAIFVRALNTSAWQRRIKGMRWKREAMRYVRGDAPFLVSQNMHLSLNRSLGTAGTPITGRIAMGSLKCTSGIHQTQEQWHQFPSSVRFIAPSYTGQRTQGSSLMWAAQRSQNQSPSGILTTP